MDLSEEYILIRDAVRRFTQKEIVPIAERVDAEDRFPPDFFKKCAQLGLLGPTVAEEYGGLDADPLTHVLITEEMAKGSGGLALSYIAHSNLCNHNICRHGSEYIRKKYLPGLCSGDLVGAMALTEPGAGSDAVGIKTSAVREGDFFKLNGSKMFITNAPIADVMLVYARTDQDKGAHGITAFAVENAFAGVSVSRKLKKMGCNGSPTGEVVFEDGLVPKENVVGEVNAGIAVMMSGLDIERVVVGAMALGLAEAAFQDSLKYAKEREQFGRPIADFQLIQAKLADMYTSIEAARLMIYDTAARTGASTRRLRKESAAAVLFTAEMATRVCLEAIQIHGGYGYMLEFPVNRYMRDAKLLEIGAGTSEIRRLLIARELLA